MMWHLLFLLLFLPTDVIAKEKILIATYPIPLMVESETKGLFIEFYKSLFAKENVDIEILVLPRNRALEYFRLKKVLIFAPAVGEDNLGKDILKSENFYYKTDFLFYRKNERISNIKSAHAKVVGTTLGYPYSKKIINNPAVSFEVAPSDEANFKKLASKRVDAFLVEELTGIRALKNSGVNDITYDKAYPISTMPVYFQLLNNAQGEKWLKFLNNKINHINNTQPLKEQFKLRNDL